MTKKRRKNKKSTLASALFLIAVIVSVVLICISVGDKGEVSADVSNALTSETSETSPEQSAADISEADESTESTESEISTEPPFEPYVIDQGLYSAEAVVYDRATDTVIAAKDAYTRMAPASLTKIATAITVIEMCDDLDEKLTCTQDTVNVTYLAGASVVGFKGGEKATVMDMLYGVMLPSGADAAITLAIRFGGSETGFAEIINQKMDKIGLTDTHFCNVTGLDEDGHYSTAADMAILLDYCLDNETFRRLCTTKYYTLQTCSKHEGGIEVTNTAYTAFTKAGLLSSYFKGGKTGTTDAAGRCLAGLCVIDDREYVTVTLGAGGDAADGYIACDFIYLSETVIPQINY